MGCVPLIHQAQGNLYQHWLCLIVLLYTTLHSSLNRTPQSIRIEVLSLTQFSVCMTLHVHGMWKGRNLTKWEHEVADGEYMLLSSLIPRHGNEYLLHAVLALSHQTVISPV